MNVLVGVSGGIAAFKAVALVRELARAGAKVRVAMTPSATRFVGAATFAGITGEPPVTDLWSSPGEIHVTLGAWADVVVIAPATASTLARLAHGIADDAVTATVLCARGRIAVAPAMHHRMWASAATQANLALLRARGVEVVGPEDGPLASGESGLGRMSEPDTIAAAVLRLGAAAAPGDLAGRHVLVSAGPTYEPIDPVRFVGNRSSGRMGYAIAEAAARRGARVTLVSGPVALAAPAGVERTSVRTALEMQAAIEALVPELDAIIMAAAVADFRPAEVATEKIKKREGVPPPAITLVRNPDILAGLGAARAARRAPRPVLVGFAVESSRLRQRAREKLEAKKVDLVVGNDAAIAFEGDESEVLFVDAAGATRSGRRTKHAIADLLLDRVARLLEGRPRGDAPPHRGRPQRTRRPVARR